MPSLHFPAIDADEAVIDMVGPHNSPLKWLTVQRIRPGVSRSGHTFDTGDREYVLDILGGRCTVNIKAGSRSATFPEIGGRRNVFEGRPTMVYIPRDATVSIYAEDDLFDGVLMSAAAENAHPPALICPEETQTRTIGKDNWQRTVHTSVGDNVRADRLIVGETLNPPGNWSSAPPHKHDSSEGDEEVMEEVYFYMTNPPQGFGLQRIYTAPGHEDPLDEVYAVKHGDVVVLPRGYHPVVAAPGYQLCYLWELAGEQRKYGAWSDDPDHAWIKDT